MEIISITTNVSRFGGAQKVMLDVHNGLKKHYSCKIIGFQKFESLHQKYNIQKHEYLLLRHPWQLNGKILIVHSRNLIPFFVALKKILFLNTKIIYVSHNVYNTHRSLTIFPDVIVSISEKVTENLVQYFKQNPKKIHLIYNGITDAAKDLTDEPPEKSKSIKILYAARVNKIKQQLLILEKLRSVLEDGIELHFAGVGEDFEQLKEACAGLPNFKALGFVENMNNLIKEYDYMMLYSVQEGLPIALLEGIMNGKPLLVNDIGGNLEIAEPGKNGIQLTDWESMVDQINGLKNISPERYRFMSKQSREIYLQKFQYDKMIENYRLLIESYFGVK